MNFRYIMMPVLGEIGLLFPFSFAKVGGEAYSIGQYALASFSEALACFSAAMMLWIVLKYTYVILFTNEDYTPKGLI